ncbi:MAG: N-acetylmuramoyl-L-alanine amidase, partial [Actinomycetota bacterium]|nr:N-acetylmuramoyl-L-alanine amidase [Actinomycetota bacterium]
ALRLLGYPLEQDASEGHPAIVRAFHRRFRGDEGDVLDAQDARILYSLTREAGRAEAGPSPAIR